MQLFGEPLELVILDVDGVILELVEPVTKCLRILAQENGVSADPIDPYFREVSAGKRHGFTGVAEWIRAFWPEQDAMRLTLRFQELKRLDPWPAIEGSIETLCWLKGAGLHLALCTSNDEPTLKRILEHVGVDLSMFEAISTWETEFRKPDPRCLDPMFDKLGVSRERAVYIGDWFPDLAVSRGAGVRFIAVLSGGMTHQVFKSDGVPDDHILDRLADLPHLILPEPRQR